MKGIFVLGTDTGVGKTFVSSLLIKSFFEHKISVGVMKPFATGIKKYSTSNKSKDAKILIKSAKITEDDKKINPYYYSVPTAPYLASKILGQRQPDLRNIIKIYSELTKKYQFVVVEGIGGLMVPLTSKEYVLDLIKKLDLAVILVTSNKIGTINHTILTIEVCKANNIKIYGMIVNRKYKVDERVDKNLKDLFLKLTNIRILCDLPRFESKTMKNFSFDCINVNELLHMNNPQSFVS